jgi:hypothetical protein
MFTSPSSFLIGLALGNARSSNRAVQKTASARLPLKISRQWPPQEEFRDSGPRIVASRACAWFDPVLCGCYYQGAGWSSPVARWAHNPKVAGSNPAPATNQAIAQPQVTPNNSARENAEGFLVCLRVPFRGYALLSAFLTTFVFASRLASISALPYTFIVVEIWGFRCSGT